MCPLWDLRCSRPGMTLPVVVGGAEGQPHHTGMSHASAGLPSANIPLAKARQVPKAQVSGWRGQGPVSSSRKGEVPWQRL